jgi:hypothetical protein
MIGLQEELEEEIAALDIPENGRKIFYELLDFSLKRKK